MIQELTIYGYRGFGIEQTIKFSLPDGITEGKGLNFIVGANNSGKTTIIESIRAFIGSEPPTFSEGKRNISCGAKIKISIKDIRNNIEKKCDIKTIDTGGSCTTKSDKFLPNYYIVQSRRAINYEFGRSYYSRNMYTNSENVLHAQRDYRLNTFSYRLFEIVEENKEEFDKLLCRILGYDFKWMIEERDNGQYYIKYVKENIMHSSEGIGDGIWSIFTICASLFDAEDQDVIVIDEPELSIHPSLQKKLLKILIEYSMKLQIIICTHSPYFIDWDSISEGANLIRVVKENINSICYMLCDDSRAIINSFLNDIHNPHIFGLEANEIFFLEDKIILVEGQEDVVIYKKIEQELKMNLEGNFFGWGVGGAPHMEKFLYLFKNLGYKEIVAIFDGDKKEEAQKIENKFNDFNIIILQSDDIRDKKNKKGEIIKNGVTYSNGKIKEENKEYVIELFKKINKYFAE